MGNHSLIGYGEEGFSAISLRGPTTQGGLPMYGYLPSLITMAAASVFDCSVPSICRDRVRHEKLEFRAGRLLLESSNGALLGNHSLIGWTLRRTYRRDFSHMSSRVDMLWHREPTGL